MKSIANSSSETGSRLRIEAEEEFGQLALRLAGELDGGTSPALHAHLQRLELRDGQDLIIDLTAVGRVESTGVAVILEARERLAEEGHSLRLRCASDKVRKVFTVSLLRADELDEETPDRFWDPVSLAGEAALRLTHRLEELVIQAGDTSYWLLVAPWRRRPVRWREAIRQAGLIGADAVPIVAMISLLVGLIMGMQAAQQLRQFGAAIFVADLVGIATTRELGPLITAIIVAGRSGSSIAAELGSMVVTEEVDALRTMGLNPTRYLVVPRLLALLVAMPCLVMIADAIGIFGGFLVGTLNLGLGAQTYFHQTVQAIYLADVFSGLVKAVVFGAVIANVGVFEGLHVRGGPEEVGRATTRAVVKSITLVIVADAVFTALFYFV